MLTQLPVSLYVNMKQFIRRMFRACLKLLGVFIFLSVLWVLLYKYVSPPITGMMVYKWYKVENYSIDNKWKKLEEIDSSLPLALIASEDQSFLQHHGFDIKAIQEVVKSKKNRGASTISQQVAKNVFLIPTRSYFRKGLEAYFTLLIEMIWSKQRIMEVYLNIVELGEGVYGVESACQNYFKKASSEINREEAALIAVVLPNPLKMELASPSTYMRKRSQWVMQQMNNLGGEKMLSEWYE